MFLEYSLYDADTDTVEKGLGLFTGVDYDSVSELVTINLIDDYALVTSMSKSEYSEFFNKLKDAIRYGDRIIILDSVCVCDDEDNNIIKKDLIKASRKY